MHEAAGDHLLVVHVLFFFFQQKTAYELSLGLVGSEMCIGDRCRGGLNNTFPIHLLILLSCWNAWNAYPVSILSVFLDSGSPASSGMTALFKYKKAPLHFQVNRAFQGCVLIKSGIVFQFFNLFSNVSQFFS